MIRKFGVLAALGVLLSIALCGPSVAQVRVVASCNGATLFPTGSSATLVIDPKGNLCAANSNTVAATVAIDQTTPGTTNNVTTPAIGSNGSAVKTSSELIGVSDGTNQQQLVAPIALGDGVNGNNEIAAALWGWNGATFDRVRADTTAGLWMQLKAALPAGTSIVGKVGIDQTTDVATNGVEIAPTAGAAAGITPVVSASAESGHVLKGSAGNLYSAYVTTGATGGYLMIFNATSAPGDGAVTPIHCIQAPANQTVSVSFNPGPAEVYATGITAVFSTTGCFTKTASATAFFHGSVK